MSSSTRCETLPENLIDCANINSCIFFISALRRLPFPKLNIYAALAKRPILPFSFYLTNDWFCLTNVQASRERLKRASPTCQPGKVVPSGMRPIGNEMGSQNGQLCSYSGSSRLSKTPTERETPTEAEWRVAFRPHAIIATDRSVPSPIFVAALVGVEKILRIDLDTSLPEETYAQQALAKVPEQTIAFGRPIGVTVNYAPDRAVRYDLTGNPVETLTEAVRCGKAYFRVLPHEEGDCYDRF
jgi:hypothetical protein